MVRTTESRYAVKVTQGYRFAPEPALAWCSENAKRADQEAFRDLGRPPRDFIKPARGERKGGGPGP